MLPHIAPLTLPQSPFPDINLPATTIGISPKNTIVVDSDSGAVHAPQDDGSVIISFGGKKRSNAPGEAKHDENLADKLSQSELAMLAEEIHRGIEEDIRSRREWEETYIRGIDLLGLKLEDATLDVTSQGTVSRSYHPLLLEAVVRYQSNAAAELLPSNGPVKVRDDNPNSVPGEIQLAEAFEKDYNHYFTTVAREYYPDSRRMFFAQGFCGNGFKKIYRCPLRKRPVSDYVAAKDFIVSNDIVSLNNCGRMTHRTTMRYSILKRLQLSGHYCDVELGQPYSEVDEVDRKIKMVEGLSTQTNIPGDKLFTIYECYTEYNLPGFEHKKGSEATGLPLPYRITLDKDSKKILEIRRNWHEDDEDYMPRQRFVKYGFIPGLGFYDYGLVHLLGNTARSLTAIQRQLIDAGQFANFPGLLLSDVGGRQETTQIQVPPGGAHVIKTGGLPMNQVVMPLPYKEPSATLIKIAEVIEANGRRLGGTAEIEVGEGRADVPVGTTVALIEQATKVMSAVHKMNHESQQLEFQLLRELFAEDPEALWKFAKNPARKWQMSEEFTNMELVPASDPNVPSHIHRVMQSTALSQLMGMFGQDLNRREVLSVILSTLGYAPASLINPAPPPGAQPQIAPQDQAKLAKVDLEKQKQQREAQTTVVNTQLRIKEKQAELIDNAKERESSERIEAMKIQEAKIHEGARLALETHKLQQEKEQDQKNEVAES